MRVAVVVISPVISVSMKWREVVGGHWVELGGHSRLVREYVAMGNGREKRFAIFSKFSNFAGRIYSVRLAVTEAWWSD